MGTVMPDGINVNPEGLDFYDRLTDEIVTAGLQPWVTLYHWELPQPLAEAGGWRTRDITDRFADYAQTVMVRIGDRMHAMAPINERWCVAWLSHFDRHHAPGLRDIRAAARAMHHVGLANGRAVQAMRATGITNIGAVCNFERIHPVNDTAADCAAAVRYHGIYNRWILGATLRGAYPEDTLDALAPHMPDRWPEDMATAAAPLDWFGLNYYTCCRIVAVSGAFPACSCWLGPASRTQTGWEIHPEGLFHFLTWVAQMYTGNLPLYVTETGLAHADTPERPDIERMAYIALGVPLRGYFVWSLLDNYERTFGYDLRFGPVHVDFETLERMPKASYHALTRARSG
jgi:beta-glucosidase